GLGRMQTQRPGLLEPKGPALHSRISSLGRLEIPAQIARQILPRLARKERGGWGGEASRANSTRAIQPPEYGWNRPIVAVSLYGKVQLPRKQSRDRRA